jgi:hypothetical protein
MCVDCRKVIAFREGCWIQALKELSVKAAQEKSRRYEENRKIDWQNLQPIEDCENEV